MKDKGELLSDCVNARGEVTTIGLGALRTLLESLQAFLAGHNDNTGASCRIDSRRPRSAS